MPGSSWTWTLTVRTEDREITFSGLTDAPENSTAESILPGILRGVPASGRDRNGNVNPVHFGASKTA